MSRDENKENFFTKHKAKLIGAAVGVTAGAVAIPVGLAALGFGAGGVVAGSAAAGLQSRVLRQTLKRPKI